MSGSTPPAAEMAAGAISPGASQPVSLRANRDFMLVLAGQAISALGDAITLTALPLLVLSLTGSGALLGIVAALELVPQVLLGLPAGALADRWDRRRMLMWSDAGRAILTLAIPLSIWLGGPTVAVIVVVVVPINALRVLSDAAYTSAVPALVGREHLGRALGYVEATLSVPFIIGPAIAGVLVATIGAGPTIAIDAATFAGSAASLVLVRRSLRAERPADLPNLVPDIRQGLAFVWRNVLVRMLVAYWSAFGVAVAALIPVLSFYITIDRGFGPELFGLVGSTWSVGYLVGSLLVGRLGGHHVGLRLVACSLALGFAVATIALTSSVPIYLAAGFVIGVAFAIAMVSYATLRVSATPDDLLGRVGGTARVIALGVQPIGLLVAGILMDAADGSTTLIVMSGAAILLGLGIGLSRTLRRARSADPGAGSG